MTLRLLTLLAIAVVVLGALLTYLRGGPPKAYWPTGTRRHMGEGEVGRERGEWSYWYRSGQLRESGSFKGFHRSGTWTQWYPSGQKASTGERAWSESAKKSVRHGEWTTWFPNGDLASRGSYKAGKRVGVWEFWRLDAEQAVPDPERGGTYEGDLRVE
ncbi:MAG: hypothetical protein O2816_03900 [Planctomycetota bacterium]|nr:hypothetical protein [Planctomycetota bacterium]